MDRLLTTLPCIAQGKGFVSLQRAVSVWWQPLSGLASWKRGYLAETQWCWWEEDTIEVKEHIEPGWCLRCQRLLPCCVEANALACVEIRSVEVPRAISWTVRLLSYSPMQTTMRSAGIVSILCLSLALTNTYVAYKEGLNIFMQRAQHTARDGAKSHNEKQKQREVNE